MRFGLLGPVEVRANEVLVPVQRPQRRAVLAYLLLHANRAVTATELIDALWDGAEPSTAKAQVHTSVSTLRRVLRDSGIDPIESVPGGYRLTSADDEIDLFVFQELTKTAAGLADHEPAIQGLRNGLRLWRGAALSGVYAAFVEPARAQLEELRLSATELLFERQLAAGRHSETVAELTALVGAQPLREGFLRQLMIALYRTGRAADAIDVYRHFQELLAEEYGLGPGRQLAELEHAILTADASLDLATVAAPTANGPSVLPPDLRDFAGRGDALRDLDALLPTSDTTAVGIHAITGTAGVGKTALAIHWSHRNRGHFPDGQLYINLNGYDPTLRRRPIDAIARLLRALGVSSERIPLNLDEATDLYRAELADKRLLIVLDNAGTAEQVRHLLPGSPGCFVVVTSRNRLSGLVARDGARRLSLDVLTDDESTRLLAAIVGERRMAAEPSAALRLIRLCGNLPLALRIAAARVADQPDVSIAAYVDRLAGPQRLEMLTIPDDPTTSVRAAFDLSYATLTHRARTVFNMASLIPGEDLASELAAAAAGLSVADTAKEVHRLVTGHLLQEVARGRYAYHDLLKAYARENVKAAERLSAIERIYGWYLSGVDSSARLLYPQMVRLDPPQGWTRSAVAPILTDASAATGWLAGEHANMVAAVTVPRPDSDRLVSLLADWLRGYLFSVTALVDWIACASAGLQAAQRSTDLRGQVAAHNSLGIAHSNGEREDAIVVEHFTKAAQLSEIAGWSLGQAVALGSLAAHHTNVGRLELGIEFHERALKINQMLGVVSGQAVNLGNLGNLYFRMGSLSTAVDYILQALVLHREIQAPSSEAMQLLNLGIALRYLGRFTEAEQATVQSIELYDQCANARLRSVAMVSLAETQRLLGRPDEALRTALIANEHLRDLDSPGYEQTSQVQLGEFYRRAGDHSRAVEHYQHAIRIADETPAVVAHSFKAFGGLGIIRSTAGDSAEARRLADAAKSAAAATGYQLAEVELLPMLAEIYFHLGDLRTAQEIGSQAVRETENIGDLVDLAEALIVLGHATTGDEQRRSWTRALDILDSIGGGRAADVRELLASKSR